MTRLLTADEAAAILGVSPSLVLALARSGELPAIRLGRLIRIPAGALEGLVERYTRPHAPQEAYIEQLKVDGEGGPA